MIIMALVLALLIDALIIKRVAIFRLGNFLPYAIPGIVAAMVWLYLYTPEISPLVKGLAVGPGRRFSQGIERGRVAHA